jgi:hypothetical protein
LRQITLDQTARAAEFPEHYEVYVTDDAAARGKAVASGTGTAQPHHNQLTRGNRRPITDHSQHGGAP